MKIPMFGGTGNMEDEVKVQEYMVPLYHVELVRDKVIPYRSVDSSEAAAEVFHEMLDSSPVEKMAVIHCNSALKMIGAEIVAMGSHEMVTAQMRDILRGAILDNAASIWIAHNHVSGAVRASIPDFIFTVQVLDACTMMHLRLEDHLVIAPGEHYSINKHQLELEREWQEEETRKALRKLGGGSFDSSFIELFDSLPKLPKLR